jgi:hypothetical protein
MAAGEGPLGEDHVVAFPPAPTSGMLGVLVREGRVDEFRRLERENRVRIWRVRGVVSDHIPLSGDARSVLAQVPQHNFFVNNPPLSIYLHAGGANAIYYDLVANEAGKLAHIEVRIETNVPGKALILAWRPLNALLDALVRNSELPWALSRLELLSPEDGEAIAYELVLPHRNGVRIGPLGGIDQVVPFAPYDAIYREAIVSSSPFYRLLCAFRIYDGTTEIRRWLRQQCDEHHIEERMPGDPEVDAAELRGLGYEAEVINGIRRARDLFERFREHRNAIAHFLVEGEQVQAHVYLADGFMIRTYSMGAVALLKYAHRTLQQLRLFYTAHLEQIFMRGMVLPVPEQRDRYVVRDNI